MTLLRMTGIGKTFPGVRALDQADLTKENVDQYLDVGFDS